MIAGLIRWSARNIFLIALASIFLTLAGVYAVSRVPLDAIPDLSDVQVIIYNEYPGQAPQVVEDQVTYPLTTAMLSVPKSRVVRGFSSSASRSSTSSLRTAPISTGRARVCSNISVLPPGVCLPGSPRPSVPMRRGLVGSTNTSCAARRKIWPICERSRIGTSAMASPNRRAWPRSPASAGSSNNTAS